MRDETPSVASETGGLERQKSAFETAGDEAVRTDEPSREQLLVELRFLRERLENLEAKNPLSETISNPAGEVSKRREAILHSALDCIITIDAAGLILEFNPAAERVFGYRREDVLGKSMAERIIPPALRKAHFVGLQHYIDSGEGPVLNQRFEITAMHASGDEFPVELAITPDRIAGRQIFTAYVRDLTEHKRTQAALRHSEAQLRESQKMEAVSQLAGGIAHDVNNLLTVILGCSEVIQRKAGEEADVRKWAREIQTASERAGVITQQLLAFGRQQVIAAQPLDLNQILSDAAAMLSRVIPETIQIETQLAPRPLFLSADPSQLNQILLNLALNARDAITENGTVTLRASAGDLDAHEANYRGLDLGSYAIFEVIDTGCGMISDVAERAFEPFFTTKEVDAGTGMGLATVYGIAKQLGGTAEIESEPGTGTLVRLYFPRIDGSVPAEPSAPMKTNPAGGGETILVVEDEQMVRDFVCEVLQSEGYRVISASDGEEALRIMETGPERSFDLLVSDMVMPNLGGHELAERVKARLPDISVILMTGYSKTDRPQTLSTGDPIHHIDKPFHPNVLITQVRETLEAK